MTRPTPNDPIHGRGASANPVNRFESIEYEPDPESYDPELPPPLTRLYRDSTKSIIVEHDSPDIPFPSSVNPYRGCEHGCAYCYARPGHEFLGFSAGLDFESRIMVKENAPALLRAALRSPKWKPQELAFSGVTDCYQPIERKLEITRRCLQVCLEFRNPVVIITKNKLVTRDIDILAELAAMQAAAVMVSVTTLDAALARALEPRASTPADRLAAIEALNAAGIPAGVMAAPCIPGLTDHEMPAILEAAAARGAKRAGYVMLRLPYGLKEIFSKWLEQHYPERKDKVLNHIRDVRGGKLNDSRFGKRMRGEGHYADQVSAMFKIHTRRLGMNQSGFTLSADRFRDPGDGQQMLF